jgi:hypothetical protein
MAMNTGRESQEVAVRKRSRADMVHFELNLEDAPLFATQARNADRKVVEYTEHYRTKDGSPGQRTWRLKPPEEYGDLDIFDQDVYMAVNALVQMRGGMPVDGKIPFTVYEIVQILGLPTNGKNYAKVRRSILRIAKTLIDAENAFYSRETLSYESEHFIIWRVHFEANADKYGRASERHTLRFDELLVRSHRAGHIKPLDVNFYLSLDRTPAKSLYRRIDQRRGDGLVWSVKLQVLKELLGMAASYCYPSKIKEKLAPSHEELKQKGFLKSVTYREKDVVRYEVSEEFVAHRSYLDRAWTYEENAAVRALIRNGVWANVARELVAERGPDLCSYYVEALPYQKGVRSSGAWLKKYISEKLPLPVEPPQKRLDDPDLAPAQNERETNQWPPSPDPAAKELWERVIDDLSGQIDGSSLHVWFERTVPTALERENLTLAVPNFFAKEYIETRFGELIESALKERLSKKASLLVIVGGSANL